MADYTYTLEGGSYSSGTIKENNYILFGSSASSNAIMGITYQFIPTGGSTSSGSIGDFPIGGGHSNTGGTMLVSITYNAVGGSTSSGSIPMSFSIPCIGGSTSAGEMYVEELDALVAYACYVLSQTGRTHQYSFEDFRGFARFNNKFMGIRDNGIYDLETPASNDNGTAISAYMELKTDFNMPEFKRLMNFMLAGEGTQFKVTITDYEGVVNTYTLTHDEFRHLARSTKTKAMTVKIENVGGEAITIRQLKGKLDIFKH